MISIIIPAHDEEALIARGLRALTEGVSPGEMEIVVVCNNCTDRTAEIARTFGGCVRVLEIPIASKVAALNAGDEVATGFPRFYVDADVVIDAQSVRNMAAVLRQGGYLMANPSLRLEDGRSSWAVRAYYRVWTGLPYNNTAGMVGTGVYAVSREGRARWGRFPELVSDDGFVRFQFSAAERTRVENAFSTVPAPRRFRDLVRIKTRSRFGLMQMRDAGNVSADRKSGLSVLAALLKNPGAWPGVPVYCIVNAVTRVRAKGQLRKSSYNWERDASARQESVPEVPNCLAAGDHR